MSEQSEFQRKQVEKMWVCACVKRDRKGQMTHLKVHDRSVVKCRQCGSTLKQHDELAKAHA